MKEHDGHVKPENLVFHVLSKLQIENLINILTLKEHDDCISSHHRSKSNATMMDEQLDFLLLNLHHLSKHRAEKMFPLVTEYEILQNVCGNVRDFHGLIVNGCIKHEMVEHVLPLFQLMAERVGHFLWEDHIDDQNGRESRLFKLAHILLKIIPIDQINEDSQLSELDKDDQTDKDSQLSELDEDDQNSRESRLFKLADLLLKIIPIELEVMHICYTNLKASTSAQVGCFIKQLLEISPDVLSEYLIHLQEHMVNVITTTTSGAQNIHVMIEFLLIILSDMPKDFTHYDKLFDLLARVGALIREVSTLVRDLEEKSRNKESTDDTNRATLKLLENIELLKEDLKHVYLKVPDSSQCCFPMSDGPLFMHLLQRHLDDLLDSNAYSIALIKEEIGLVKEDLEFIRSFFANIEQGLYKDLWARFLNVAYEAKDVIDSIIVRDNGLLHLLFSLPSTIKKIKLIKEEVSNLLEKIPKNKSLVVVNSPKKPVESKSLTTSKIIVGFEEETNLIIRKLTSGPAYVDVISITGMPGSGKTTLAYKVYNDKSVSSHFDLRTWCTVDHLPDHLKPCLLYLASFPKDTAMTIWVVKDLWRIEGLVEQTEMKSVEEVMDVYLDDLISSSLVIRFNEIGRYPTCQFHDLVHDFCLIKARKEKLFECISSSAPSSSDLMPRIVTIEYNRKFFGLDNFFLFSSKKKRHSGKHLYSLTIGGDELDDRLSDVCHLRHLRLLRGLSLDPSFINMNDSLLNEICMLNHLRFLSIGTEVKSLPSSFSNLCNLETLVVQNKGSTLVLLRRIWDLVKLRVLFMNACSFFDESIVIAEDTKLEKLRYLEKLVLFYSEDTEDIFKRLPNLQMLTFVLKESWDCSTEQYWFPKLDCLTESQMLTLAKWEVGEESFPVLEKLVLRGCRKLEEIPPCFIENYQTCREPSS